jgi:hypothetical protein
VTYHESFWIAVAAAAPVVALAAIVAFTDIAGISGGRRAPGDTDPDVIKLGRRLLWSGYATGLGNVLLQAVMLLLALLSLAAGHDQAPLIVAEVTTPLGVLLLLVASVLAVLERIVVHYAEHGLPE